MKAASTKATKIKSFMVAEVRVFEVVFCESENESRRILGSWGGESKPKLALKAAK